MGRRPGGDLLVVVVLQPRAPGDRRPGGGWRYGLVVIGSGLAVTQADETMAPLFARMRK